MSRRSATGRHAHEAGFTNREYTGPREALDLLSEKEAQYRAIFEGTGDALLITRLDGFVAEANPAACAMYGYQRSDIVGKPLSDLISVSYHTLLHEILKRIEDGEEFVIQAVDRKRDGTFFDVEVHVSSFSYAGQPHMLSVVRDVTDRIRGVQVLEQRVQERTRELSTLLQVAHDVASALELEPLLSKILDVLAEVVDYDAAAIFTLTDHDSLTLLDYRGPWSVLTLPRRWDLSQVEHIRMVLDHRQPLMIPDVHAATLRAQAWQRSWGAELGVLAQHSVSWLGVPLVAKDHIIGTLTLEHGEAGHFTPLHAKLALAFANQIAVAIESARLHEASQRLAVIEERHRIARDLHDSVSQALYGIGLGVRTARATLTADPTQASEALAYVLDLAETALAEMRTLLLELRTDALERDGLVSALDKQIAGLRGRYDLEITTDFPEEPVLPIEAKEALYRVIHEALSNIVKHAQARHVRLELAATEKAVTLTVQDDGVGFDPDRSYPGHFGLQSMRERMQRLGGELTVDSAPDRGTSVRAVVHR